VLVHQQSPIFKQQIPASKLREHLTLQEYAETVYFPHAKKSLKPSTYKGYFNLNPNTLSHALPDLDC
jgi:hypothetical protein